MLLLGNGSLLTKGDVRAESVTSRGITEVSILFNTVILLSPVKNGNFNICMRNILSNKINDFNAN